MPDLFACRERGNSGCAEPLLQGGVFWKSKEQTMLTRPLQPAIVLGLALALGSSAAMAATKKSAQTQNPATAQASVSEPSANTAVPGSPPTAPGATNQQNCWIPIDDDKAYGFYGACSTARARQMK
jgi:hypothetical protein